MPQTTLMNAHLVDGTGEAARPANVTIEQGKIIEISEPGSNVDGDMMDLSGLVLAPGFIDIHSHADYTLLRDGGAESAILQGVTSVVIGNCGHGVAPVGALSENIVFTNGLGYDPRDDLAITWRSYGEYMDRLRERGVAVNVFPLVAHGALRMSVAGYADRKLDRKELVALAGELEDAMTHGAVGLSSGLEYAPGIAADEHELLAVAEGLKDFDALYSTHCRNRSHAMPQATQEAVTVAEGARCRLQMSHFIRRPNTPDALVQQSWRAIREARERGLTAYADVFPFDYGPTPLAVLIPLRLRSDDSAEMAVKLKDPKFRAKVLGGVSGMFATAMQNGLVASMYVVADGADGEFVGQSLVQIATRLKLDPVEAAYWLLENAGASYHNVTIIENWAVWSDLLDALEDEDFYIMGDGVTGALDDGRPALTLSDWGYAPRFLSQFVRDGTGRISLEQAIHRMTLGPARQIGLKDRGSIEVGQAADLVAFDYRSIGTNVSPTSLKKPPVGVRNVWVNGDAVVADGEKCIGRPGRVGLQR